MGKMCEEENQMYITGLSKAAAAQNKKNAARKAGSRSRGLRRESIWDEVENL